MRSLRVDELDKMKTFAQKAIKLTADGTLAPKSKTNPVGTEDRAKPWYFTHT